MKRKYRLLVTIVLACVWAGGASIPVSAQQTETWVERSDRNAQVLLDVMARFSPEMAGGIGMTGLDEQILQLPLDRNQQWIKATQEALQVLKDRLEKETETPVRQDLEILIAAAELNIKQLRLNAEQMLPYNNLPQVIYFGLRALLDDQVAPERRPAALVRLQRYAGLEKGWTPLTTQAENYLRAHLDRAELIGPYRREVERDLAMLPRYLDGIGELLRQYQIADSEQPLEMLRSQLSGYETLIREEVMPRTREDFRLPPEIYALLLENLGIDMPATELASRAKVAFREIQLEMQALAPLIAEQRNLSSGDYRDVIRHLKQEQLIGEEILPHYRQRIRQLEQIVRAQEVVTLPAREMVVRLASEAESAAIPSPILRPPRLLGNTGEMAEFVLPLTVPGADAERKLDDYTFAAASWTLAVHEGRPGHELQISSLIERGVSKTRAIFAFNSVNVEGWAVYCEAEMKPYLPLEGQLISLQQRLLRAARAFLDPALQAGTISRQEVLQVLQDDVVLSPAMAEQEIERYTFLDPGQAASYFCGYLALMELRADAERIMGKRFHRRAFHDLLLSQGLLPLPLLREVVVNELTVKPSGE
jgi:hypothetical protein